MKKKINSALIQLTLAYIQHDDIGYAQKKTPQPRLQNPFNKYYIQPYVRYVGTYVYRARRICI